MSVLFDEPAERVLVRLAADGDAHDASDAVVAAARSHGMEALLFRGGARAPSPRALALELQHQAIMADLAAIAEAFESAAIRALVLKGPSIAERLYDPPWSRPSTDIDLLVAPDDLARAEAALVHAGWQGEATARERFFRERHFHLHFHKPGRMPVELHFHAYRGFGALLTAQDLFEGASPHAAIPSPLLVPETSRELVYLAAHAAAHRFQRMGWLFDIALALRHVSPNELASARRFASARGFDRAFAAAMRLVAETFPTMVERAEPPRSRHAGTRLALRLAKEPRSAPLRSMTRFLFVLALCDDSRARARYAARAVVDKIVHPGA